MKIALLRHGPTEWNEEGRIQGQIDIPLSDQGRAKFALLSPPDGFAGARPFSSPLSRALQSAMLLGLRDPTIDARLAEHHWGRWEGMTRAEILASEGEHAFANAGTGADFTPPGGERTADLIARVRNFLIDVSQSNECAIAITHRGVLRSAYAIATGWEMLKPMPEKLDLSSALVIEVGPDETIRVAELNLRLPKRR